MFGARCPYCEIDRLQRAVNECIQAIERGESHDNDGVMIHMQWFGQAFLDHLKEVVQLRERFKPTIVFWYGGDFTMLVGDDIQPDDGLEILTENLIGGPI